MSETLKTVNQNIMPLNTKRNAKGNLEISGCDTVDLVEKYGTPLYVMDEVTLRAIAREYKDAFKNYKKVNMMFALMLYRAAKFTP